MRSATQLLKPVTYMLGDQSQLTGGPGTILPGTASQATDVCSHSLGATRPLQH